MSTLAPIVSWYEGTNETKNEIKGVVNYGIVDADSASPIKTLYIWNNRNGDQDCPKMEEVRFTTRDRQGGTGDTPGAIVEAVRDNWFQVRCDSMDETRFVPVGKGGVENALGTHLLGTKGTTKNIDVDVAKTWAASTALELNDVISIPDTDVLFVVTKAGITGEAEPVWSSIEGETILDGNVELVAMPKEKTPEAGEILGFKNNVLEDGSNAEDAGGNFVKISVYAEVPVTASAGKNQLLKRISYRYV